MPKSPMKEWSRDIFEDSPPPKAEQKTETPAEGTANELSPLEQAELNADAYAEALRDDENLRPDQKEEMLSEMKKALETFENTMFAYAENITDTEKKRLLTGMENTLGALERDASTKKEESREALKAWADYRDKLQTVNAQLDKMDEEERRRAGGGRKSA